MLPNYSVFDEERYFEAGKNAAVFKLNGIRIGMTICEDVWRPEPIARSRSAGAECIIAINGSPYELRHARSGAKRRCAHASQKSVFRSFISTWSAARTNWSSTAVLSSWTPTARSRFRAPPFEEALRTIALNGTAKGVVPEPGDCAAALSTEASIYKALVTGTRDYVTKHGFPGVVIGLSGGIDSALVLAIACDAIGAERVRAVMMPFRYTSTMSQEDAAKQAATLGVRYDVIPIEPMYEATVRQLQPIFGDKPADVTEENIQARCRGLLLMAISNKTGRMLLTTGNKSEMAVGYATLYGDMAGGFAPIKDCSKTLVYRLARYRNTLGRCDSGARHHAAAVGRTAARSERHGLAARLRRARSDPRGVHRRRPFGRRNNGSRDSIAIR